MLNACQPMSVLPEVLPQNTVVAELAMLMTMSPRSPVITDSGVPSMLMLLMLGSTLTRRVSARAQLARSAGDSERGLLTKNVLPTPIPLPASHLNVDAVNTWLTAVVHL